MMANTTNYNDAPANCIPFIDDGAAPPHLAIVAGTYHQNGRYSRTSPYQTLPGYTITNDEGISYPGGKGNVYQKIINLIPPHRVYIESHAGGGAVLRNKMPARLNIAIDLDSDVIKNLRLSIATSDDKDRWQFIVGDAVTLLRAYEFQGDEFVYADPPYLMETRRQQRPLYRYELTRQDHITLLTLLTALPCKVMISGYWSQLYDDALTGWHVVSFETRTRGGTWATEYLWTNYPPPSRLHDYRYLGDNYRERERIKRKKQRWADKWAKMSTLERQAILSVLEKID